MTLERDWIGAVARAVKEIPGAGVILSPLLHLKGEEERRKANAEIAKAIQANREVGLEILREMRREGQLEGEGTDLELAERIALRVAKKLRQGSDIEGDPGRFYSDALGSPIYKPIPVPRGMAVKALHELFPAAEDLAPLRDCLTYFDLPVPEVYQDAGEFIRRAVTGLRAQEPRSVLGLFRCLRDRREGSAFLAFVCQYLEG